MAGPNGAEDCIPTVITCPKLSKDMSSSLKMLANHLYQYNEQGAESAKPPILIITDVIASDEVIMDDIANLCGCKTIRKYIDPRNGLSVAMLVSAVIAETDVVVMLVAIGKISKVSNHTKIFKSQRHALLCGIFHKCVKARKSKVVYGRRLPTA